MVGPGQGEEMNAENRINHASFCTALASHPSLQLIRYLQRTEGTASVINLLLLLTIMEYSNANRGLNIHYMPRQEMGVI